MYEIRAAQPLRDRIVSSCPVTPKTLLRCCEPREGDDDEQQEEASDIIVGTFSLSNQITIYYYFAVGSQ